MVALLSSALYQKVQMSDQVEVIITAGLIKKTELHAIITYGKRTFNAQLSLAGEFAVQSDDRMPIPLNVLWYGYIEMHKYAVEMRTGQPVDSQDPVQQVSLPLTEKKSLQQRLHEEGEA